MQALAFRIYGLSAAMVICITSGYILIVVKSISDPSPASAADNCLGIALLYFSICITYFIFILLQSFLDEMIPPIPKKQPLLKIENKNGKDISIKAIRASHPSNYYGTIPLKSAPVPKEKVKDLNNSVYFW